MSAVMQITTENNPAALCAAVEKAGGRYRRGTHRQAAASQPIVEGVAKASVQPIVSVPSLDMPIVDVAAYLPAQPSIASPHVNVPFRTNPEHQPAIETVLEFYRLRQDMIKARTKLILQAQASLRRYFDGDKEKAAAAYSAACKDESHEFRPFVGVYIDALSGLTARQGEFEKQMVKAVKTLPIYAWAKGVKGFGDASLACIIGEASGNHRDTGEFYSVGDFKSVSALWKRMGLAVINGERQRRKAGDEALIHAYSPTRRSVMWNVGNGIILGMGKFRPMFGEDVDANPDYTTLQKVFANRARYLAVRDDKPVKESASGKDSYTAHIAASAKRYAEKRLLRLLWAEWRRCMA